MIEEVIEKYLLGAGGFTRKEVEVLLSALIDAGEIDEVSLDDDD